MNEIILVGGGGHCRSCIDVIEQDNKYQIAGILDVKEKVGQKNLAYPIIGTDDEIESYAKRGYYFLITLGQIKSADLRAKIFDQLKIANAKIATIISPLAYVSKYAQIGEGTIVMHHALINANAKIGENCIINSKSLIEHDAIINDNCHISTGAMINGGVNVAEKSFVGSNAMIKENINIENNAIVGGGGGIILHNVPPFSKTRNH